MEGGNLFSFSTGFLYSDFIYIILYSFFSNQSDFKYFFILLFYFVSVFFVSLVIIYYNFFIISPCIRLENIYIMCVWI